MYDVDRENELRRALALASADHLEALDALFETARQPGKSIRDTFGGVIGQTLEALAQSIDAGMIRVAQERDQEDSPDHASRIEQ
jgi:hypothetical protein